MRHTRTVVGVMSLVVVLCASSSIYAGPITIIDNFNDNSLKTSLWASFIQGDGSVSEVGGRLVATIEASPDHESGAAAAAVLLGTIGGNFDVSVHYELLEDLPLTHADTGGGLFLGSAAFTFQYGVARDTHTICGPSGCPYENAYVAAVGGGEDTVATTDPSGELRLTRVGPSFSAYYRSEGLSDWQLIASGTGSTDPLPFLALGVTIAGPERVSFAFDDFTLVADEFTQVPDPGSTLLLFGIGLVGLRAWWRRLG
jgi:hypothetical protein